MKLLPIEFNFPFVGWPYKIDAKLDKTFWHHIITHGSSSLILLIWFDWQIAAMTSFVFGLGGEFKEGFCSEQGADLLDLLSISIGAWGVILLLNLISVIKIFYILLGGL